MCTSSHVKVLINSAVGLPHSAILCRKPAFASVSVETEHKSSRKHKKHRDSHAAAAPTEERLSRKERKQQKLDKLKTEIEKLSHEERAELYQAATAVKIMNKRVKYQGKKVGACDTAIEGSHPCSTCN